MRKQKIAATILVTTGLMSPLAHATNGDEMMAVGSQSTALGGSGVAHFMGAESVWANPAMLGKSKGAEFVGGLVSFTPKVTNTGLMGSAADSSASTSYIPDLSYSRRMDDNMAYGLSLAGIAGMGVDYTGANAATHMKAKSALSIMRIVMTMAYNKENFGVGFSPIYQTGSLMLSYVNAGGPVNGAQSKSSSSGFGFTLGGYYDVSSEFTVAGAYQSKFAAKYGTQISAAGTGFGLTGAQAFGDNLDQPAQMKLGVAYTMAKSVTVTADYKLIQWGSAAGYKDFNWKDQTVIALGAKYAADGYWLGVGYNKADNPIKETAAPGTVYKDAAINMFNNMFFPAVVTNSYTFGGGYAFSKTLALEASAVITPKVTTTTDVSAVAIANGAPAGTYTNTTTHSQSSYSVSLRYKF